jgi:hypothetical protein
MADRFSSAVPLLDGDQTRSPAIRRAVFGKEGAATTGDEAGSNGSRSYPASPD